MSLWLRAVAVSKHDVSLAPPGHLAGRPVFLRSSGLEFARLGARRVGTAAVVVYERGSDFAA